MMVAWARVVPWAGEKRTDPVCILEVKWQGLQINMKQGLAGDSEYQGRW